MKNLWLKLTIMTFTLAFAVGGVSAQYMPATQSSMQPAQGTGGSFPYPGLVLVYDYYLTDINQIARGGDFVRGEWVTEVQEQSQDGWIGTTQMRTTANPDGAVTEWEYIQGQDPNWEGPPLYVDLQNPANTNGGMGAMWTVVGPSTSMVRTPPDRDTRLVCNACEKSGTRHRM